METIVTQIIENWKNMSLEEFNEYMLNQQKTLLREEKEQIIDACIMVLMVDPNFFKHLTMQKNII